MSLGKSLFVDDPPMDKGAYIAAREVDKKPELEIREEIPIADIIPSLRKCLQRVDSGHLTKILRNPKPESPLSAEPV